MDRAAASEPESGSDSEYAPNHSPEHKRASTSFFKASLPNVLIAKAQRVCTDKPIAKPR